MSLGLSPQAWDIPAQLRPAMTLNITEPHTGKQCISQIQPVISAHAFHIYLFYAPAKHRPAAIWPAMPMLQLSTAWLPETTQSLSFEPQQLSLKTETIIQLIFSCPLSSLEARSAHSTPAFRRVEAEAINEEL